MDKKELIQKAGGVTALAKLLGIKAPAIYQWKTVPQLRLLQLEKLRPEWFKEAIATESVDGI